jgi:hypothetical protein
VREIGRVSVVPVGISYSIFNRIKPLKKLENLESEGIVKVTPVVLTDTAEVAILGIPALLLK